MPKAKYAGIPINDLIVPALSIGQAEQFDELVQQVTPKPEELRTAYAKRLLPLVAAAVQRNYPEMTEADVAAALDFDCFSVAVRAALALADPAAAAKTRGE
jgi:hypothetical protein